MARRLSGTIREAFLIAQKYIHKKEITVAAWMCIYRVTSASLEFKKTYSLLKPCSPPGGLSIPFLIRDNYSILRTAMQIGALSHYHFIE